MKKIKPLAKFPIIDTNQVEEAEAKITRSLTDIRIMQVQDRNYFKLQMNGLNIRRTSLVFNQFESDTKINAELDEESVLFAIGGSAPTTFHLEKESVTVSPRTAAMITSGKQMRIERSEGSELLVLRTSIADIKHHFEQLTGQYISGTLIFDHKISLINGPGAMLNQMIKHMVYAFEHNDLVMKNKRLLKSYDDMLLSSFISLLNNQKEKIYDYPNQPTPGLVYRAEEYMRAHLSSPISIIDLLSISDCSRSTLFSIFRKTRGYTPMEFLTEQRLQCARKKLLTPHSKTSVSSIALECGFINLGRFARFYRKRFGELPSGTLRKS